MQDFTFFHEKSSETRLKSFKFSTIAIILSEFYKKLPIGNFHHFNAPNVKFSNYNDTEVRKRNLTAVTSEFSTPRQFFFFRHHSAHVSHVSRRKQFELSETVSPDGHGVMYCCLQMRANTWSGFCRRDDARRIKYTPGANAHGKR